MFNETWRAVEYVEISKFRTFEMSRFQRHRHFGIPEKIKQLENILKSQNIEFSKMQNIEISRFRSFKKHSLFEFSNYDFEILEIPTISTC